MIYNTEISKKNVVYSFMWKIMERLFAQGINLMVQIILARALLPDDFGSLAILIAITNYAAIFVQSGLSTAIIQRDNLEDLDISTLLTASLAVALLFYLALFSAAPAISAYYGAGELKWALRTLALILFLNAFNSVQTAILSRRMQFKRIFLRSILAVPISGIVGIAMAYKGFGIWALVVHNLVNMLVTVLIMSIGTEMPLSFRFSLARAKAIYAFSGRILVTSLITGLHDTVRTMTIGRKYSTHDLAYYHKGYTYSNYSTQIVNASISSVLLPTFSRKQNDLVTLKSMARRSVRLSAFVMFPVLFGVAAVAKPLVTVLLTEKWLASVPFLIIFCVLRLPGCVLSVDRQVYYALGRSGVNLAYEAGLCAVNVAVLVITMGYGTRAIAVGATAVEFVGAMAIFCISARVYSYSLKERLADLVRPLMNALIMAVVCWYVPLAGLGDLRTLVIQIPLGLVLYVVLSLITRDENLAYIQNTVKGTIWRRNVTNEKKEGIL